MQFSRVKEGHRWQAWLAVFLVAEFLSWLAFNFTWLNLSILILLAVITAVFVWVKPIFALYIPLAELFWGSLGHSWQYEFINTRLLIFAIVAVIFLFKNVFKIKQQKILQDKALLSIYSFLILIFFMGLASGYYNNYPKENIFFDANAYIYLLYLPIWYQVYQSKYLQNSIAILQGAALVVAAKTLLIFNIFVHDYSFLDTHTIYKWIRDTRTGEITPFANDFTRVFMQSQFYVLIAWFVSLIQQIKNLKNKSNFFFLSVFSAALIVSLSRSFWLGGAVALLFLLINIFFYQRRMPHILVYLSIAIVGLVGVLWVEVLYNVPQWNTLNIFSQRSVDSSEAALSSRQALLPVMWDSIKEQPIIGYGFGKELTYQSSDPRIKNVSNPEGSYTTYSFEWGWLDQWLKAGVLFVTCFILWLLLIYKRSWEIISRDPDIAFISVALITSLIITHIFSPYLNHPLGLGLIMFITIIVSKYARQTQAYN